MIEDKKECDSAAEQFSSLSLENDGSGNSSKKDKQKIDILFKPTGNAPIMKRKKWAVDSDKTIGWVTEFLKKYMKLETQERLYLYVNQSFAPSPDQILRNLFDCYGTADRLTLHYCKSQAWG